MKVPHFENCQVILEPMGSIIEASEEFCDWVGQSLAKMSGQSFRNLMISMEQEWEALIPKLEHKKHAKYFLPLGMGDRSSLGIHITYQNYPHSKFLFSQLQRDLLRMIHSKTLF